MRGVQINLDPAGQGDSREWIRDPGDERWFQVNNVRPGFLQVTVDGRNDLNADVIVFDSNGGPKDSASEDGRSFARVCIPVSDEDVAGGKPFVAAVTSHEGRSTGPFTIEVRQPSVACTQDDHGNTNEQATPFTDNDISPEGNGFITGRIDTPEDRDRFKIPVRGSGFWIIEVDTRDSTLVSFLTTQQEGCDNTDGGEDGTARTVCSPNSGEGERFIIAEVKSADGSVGPYTINVWRGTNPDDDHPDSGGQFAAPHTLGEAFGIDGHIEHPGDKDAFRVLATRPGPVAVHVISRTPGFVPFLDDSWQTPDFQGDQNTDGGSGRGGQTYHCIPNVMDAPHNWVNIDISASGTRPFGDYLVYVWQPQVCNNDGLHRERRAPEDPDQFGPAASPIVLDGWGNGDIFASLERPDDRDFFQFEAARAATVIVETYRPEPPDQQVGHFVTVYDAAGNAIATAQNDLETPTVRIELDAERGQRFFVEVKGLADGRTGNYVVEVHQETDDHPDDVPHGPQISNAVSVSTLTGSAFSDTGLIEAVGDRDVLAVRATQRGIVTIDLTALDTSPVTWAGRTTGHAWITQNDGNVQLDVDGSDAPHNMNSATASTESGVNGIEFDLRAAIGSSHNSGYVEITDGTNSIRLQVGEHATAGRVMSVSTAGFGLIENATPVAFADGTTYRIRIVENAGTVRVERDGTPLARLSGIIPDSVSSTLTAFASAAAALGRFARLDISNVRPLGGTHQRGGRTGQRC